MSKDQKAVNIVGAGLGGALLAASLGKKGYRVDVYEMRLDMRKADIRGGRSINLALSYRGLCALERVGLADDVLKTVVPMTGRMMHTVGGELIYQPYGKDPSQCINSISRAGLNMTLLEAAGELDNVSMHFEHKCVSADLDQGQFNFANTRNGSTVTAKQAPVIATDGAFSVIRREMQRRDRFNYSQSYLPVGYKELTIPAADDGSFRLEKNALHIWPRGPFMMIALPNQDGSFTCTLFWPHEGPNSFEAVKTDQDVLDCFEKFFPDAIPHMPTLVDDYHQNPTSALVTIRCAPWNVGGHCALLGDAAHAVVPFYGQGMNAAFEDVIELTDALDQHQPNWEAAFSTYFQKRKEHCDALADLAIENFNVMSAKTRSPWFLMGKKIETWLHRFFPKAYLPLYSMVTFARMGYADAVRRAERQVRVVTALAVLLALVAVSTIWIMIA
ncbi:MAG: FAD-dependent oxidoreductase [Phycisphaerae bacterium]